MKSAIEDAKTFLAALSPSYATADNELALARLILEHRTDAFANARGVVRMALHALLDAEAAAGAIRAAESALDEQYGEGLDYEYR